MAEGSKEIGQLLRHLRATYPEVSACAGEPIAIDTAEPVLDQFVRSFMVWESTAAKAALAMKRIEQAVVDFNELRVCMPGELVRIIGERYPRAEERARRMRAALATVYSREHRVGLERLSELSKREAKDYLESLDGTPRFVAARVALLALGGHAAPVDGRILRRLQERGVVDADATPETAAIALERKIRAGEMMEFYSMLQAWSDDAASESAEHARPAAKEEGRKPAKAPVAPRRPRKKAGADE